MGYWISHSWIIFMGIHRIAEIIKIMRMEGERILIKKLKFQIIEGRLPISPKRGHMYDAGIDFFIPNDFEMVYVEPNSSILIKSGLRTNVPKGYALIAFNKSGVATGKSLKEPYQKDESIHFFNKNKIEIWETRPVGLIIGAQVIDHGYQGEIHFHLFNPKNHRGVYLKPGMKIAQFVLIPISNAEPITYNYYQNIYEEVSERGEGGFGSTNMAV